MRLLIISGFLGSGKTTLLLALARRWSAAGRRIAIIENEVGEIGIDGAYLRQEGLEVRELFGGCICCTLAASLVPTIEQLKMLHQPDIIIMEATGVARPGDIASNVNGYASAIKQIQVLTIVDAARYEIFSDMMAPLFEAQVIPADIIGVSKLECQDASDLRVIQSGIQLVNPNAPIIPIDADQNVCLNSFEESLQIL